MPSADGRHFHPECVLHGKKPDFSWKQLAVRRWGTNSQFPLNLIINIINPGWGVFCCCTFRVYFPAHSMQKRLPCLSQLQNSPGLCRRPWMTFKWGRKINKKITFHHSDASSHPPGFLPQPKSHPVPTVPVQPPNSLGLSPLLWVRSGFFPVFGGGASFSRVGRQLQPCCPCALAPRNVQMSVQGSAPTPHIPSSTPGWEHSGAASGLLLKSS